MYFHRTVGVLIATSLVLDIGHFPHTKKGMECKWVAMVNKICETQVVSIPMKLLHVTF